ncbi:MipA/OmpV family protein [Desulfosediminicola sp.]|uniref:MipA/OmpV family protein n=1 Tax=Desulfosediminicola sp. TaxID=2886825 RepID=UPI003AF21574
MKLLRYPVKERSPLIFTILVSAILWFPGTGNALFQEFETIEEQEWGVAAVVRTATIPYASDNNTVSSFVPMLYFNGERFFLDGMGGGVKLIEEQKYRLDLFGRLRFVDIPGGYQNDVQADTIDLGLRLRLFPTEHLVSDLEVLTDDHGRVHSNIGIKYNYHGDDLELSPYANLRYSTSTFNDYYYGYDQTSVGSGTEFSIGINARYHLWQNLYAIGNIQTTFLGDSIRNSQLVDQDRVDEFSLGIGFFNDKKKPRKRPLSNTPYLRIAHGWATESNIGDIITGGTVSDEYNNQLTSIFYGYPIADELFGIPIDVYITPGLVWHWNSSVQSSIQEYVVAIKAYYTFNWPTRWRFGVAEGLSYLSDITYIEQSEMDRKDYEPSNLMNYLDLSVDVDLGDLFKSERMRNWYLGYSIHHRSAIFESASQFGRIKGGANYNTIYLQYHF